MRNIKHVVLLLTAMIFAANMAFAQNTVTVSGTVLDGNNEPVIGASVVVKGTTKGTTTGVSGEYSISAPRNGTLVFSLVGYKTVEELIDGRTNVSVTLNEEASVLPDFVKVGYGSLERRKVTSAITSLSAQDLTSGLASATILESMKGKVTSLVMNGTDSPNSERNDIQLRGMASVNSSMGPLVVIDGMPGGDIRSVIQEDIQSIDFLKDASGAAIYGTRATGGVILITTKQAQSGKMRVSYIGERIMKQAFGKPEIMNRDQFLGYKTADYDSGIFAKEPNDYGNDTDWWDTALEPNPTSYRHVVTLQGGDPNARVYASVSYEDNKGIVRGDKRQDFAGRINGNFKTIDGWLDINTHVEYRRANRNTAVAGITGAINVNPTISPYEIIDDYLDPISSIDEKAGDISKQIWSKTGYFIWPGTMGSKLNGEGGNPLGGLLNETTLIDTWFRPDVELKLNIKPITGLSYSQTFAYEHQERKNREFTPSYTTSELDVERGGVAKLGSDQTEIFNAEGYLTFIRQIDDHSWNAVAGYSYYRRDRDYFWEQNMDFPADGATYWQMGKGTWLKEGGNTSAAMESGKDITQRLFAGFARLNYTWKDRYTLSGSYRREGSSKFAQNNKWGNFWSASGAWYISNESFMENIKWIDDLKIRGGYGVTGNEGFDANYAATLFKAYEQWMYEGDWITSYGVERNANLDLGWEEKHEWNVGVDYALFDKRLYGKVDVYLRDVVGMIYEVNVQQPPYVTETMFDNVGTLRSKGYEIEIGGDIVRGKNWNYSTSLNLSSNSTKVLSTTKDEKFIEGDGVAGLNLPAMRRLEPGVEVGQFYLLEHARYDANKTYPANHPFADESRLLIKDGGYVFDKATGNFYILDYSKDAKTGRKFADGRIDYNEGGYPTISLEDPNSRRYMGNYMPKLMLGWTHNLSWKNIEFRAVFTSWIDYDVFNEIDLLMGLPRKTEKGNTLLKAYEEHSGIYTDGIRATDYFLEDGSFLKLQSVSLQYTLKTKKWLNVLESARIYFTVNNVCRWTKYSGLNPEVDVTGWNGGSERAVGSSDHYVGLYPQTRTFTLGLQLNL
ncbi:MAG: SusC/RagA family TonB-linked outer membrane protein [Prevotellaceae bacterium]|jgi:TonB-linked SusC/RagA family outer membrane protein|nr:SusC/RagA family TonB-linked outer membrane protein [Prevotellaceae bacterium]